MIISLYLREELLGGGDLLTEDFNVIAESAVVVTSFFAVVITVLIFAETVVDAVIRVTKCHRVVDFVAGDSRLKVLRLRKKVLVLERFYLLLDE